MTYRHKWVIGHLDVTLVGVWQPCFFLSIPEIVPSCTGNISFLWQRDMCYLIDSNPKGRLITKVNLLLCLQLHTTCRLQTQLSNYILPGVLPWLIKLLNTFIIFKLFILLRSITLILHHVSPKDIVHVSSKL